MEFPHLGQHCNEKTCNRLDFLPMKCDACNQVFCSSHFNYEQHNCASGLRKDYQVPLCPLCGEPVPTAPGVEPDLTVGQHIDQQCKSDSRKIFTNRCSYKNCKRKELIPVNCSQCKRNFCLRHRHTADHECQSSSLKNETDQKRNMAAKAAEQRRTQKPPNTLFNTAPKPTTAAVRAAAAQRLTAGSSQMQTIQGNISEDEALARAIALSIMELDETNDRNRRNETAAAAAATNTQRRNNTTVPVGGNDQQQNSGKDKCSLS
ncbi:AN1-type zinc finger protein 2A [Lucilia sericata]|uniref:AN1-type zinc finger protein 2A n=1 Tax=Lucilia sericata TaxID=13632 RepID=UPI0018A7F5F2|nr:AN1-type zinc finger protein 2A [Lucilia sericata]